MTASRSMVMWSGDKQLAGQSGGMVGGPGRPNMTPDGDTRPSRRNGTSRPRGRCRTGPSYRKASIRLRDRSGRGKPPIGERPWGDAQQPDGGQNPMQRPDGSGTTELTSEFSIVDGPNMMNGITYQE